MMMDMLNDSMMLYVILGGIMIVTYMALGMRMTVGLAVGVMLGAWSQHSELVEKIITTITAQVMKDVSQMISMIT
jgi:hypothetical protein